MFSICFYFCLIFFFLMHWSCAKPWPSSKRCILNCALGILLHPSCVRRVCDWPKCPWLASASPGIRESRESRVRGDMRNRSLVFPELVLWKHTQRKHTNEATELHRRAKCSRQTDCAISVSPGTFWFNCYDVFVIPLYHKWKALFFSLFKIETFCWIREYISQPLLST